VRGNLKQSVKAAQIQELRRNLIATDAVSDTVISDPVRTPIGTFNGSLKEIPATELGALVIGETLKRSKLAPSEIGSVIIENVI
jgi:acetyl-CoA C-acetyltransferase